MASSAVSGVSMTMRVEGSLLGESRTFTVNLTGATIDVTNRDSSWWGEFLQGRREWTVDFEGMYIASDPGKKVLVDYYENRSPTVGTISLVIILADGTLQLSGEGILTSFTWDGPFEDAATISGSIQGTSTLTISVS